MPFVLPDEPEVLAAADNHPFVRSFLRFHTQVHGWSSGQAVVCAGRDERTAAWSVLGLGDPARVADLVEQVAGLLPENCDVSVPRPAAPLLTGALRLARRVEWDFRWTTRPPAAVNGEEKVTVLSVDEYGEVAGLLRQANPTAAARPEDPWVRQWVGLRDQSGRLVAVAADTSRRGVGHISSVSTAPAARGRGHGAAVTAYLTRLHVAEFGLASLGFFADNHPARRIYDRLGYDNEVAVTSGPRDTGSSS